jgi:hypothetical protein
MCTSEYRIRLSAKSHIEPAFPPDPNGALPPSDHNTSDPTRPTRPILASGTVPLGFQLTATPGPPWLPDGRATSCRHAMYLSRSNSTGDWERVGTASARPSTGCTARPAPERPRADPRYVRRTSPDSSAGPTRCVSGTGREPGQARRHGDPQQITSGHARSTQQRGRSTSSDHDPPRQQLPTVSNAADATPTNSERRAAESGT